MTFLPHPGTYFTPKHAVSQIKARADKKKKLFYCISPANEWSSSLHTAFDLQNPIQALGVLWRRYNNDQSWRKSSAAQATAEGEY